MWNWIWHECGMNMTWIRKWRWIWHECDTNVKVNLTWMWNEYDMNVKVNLARMWNESDTNLTWIGQEITYFYDLDNKYLFWPWQMMEKGTSFEYRIVNNEPGTNFTLLFLSPFSATGLTLVLVVWLSFTPDCSWGDRDRPRGYNRSGLPQARRHWGFRGFSCLSLRW